MAFSLATENGTVYIPDAYATYKVASNPSGVAASGILVLIGESSQGPSYSEETSLDLTFFGPDQVGEVQAKYGTGNLVDAFRIAAVPSADEQITGSPSGAYLLKTNLSTKAEADLLRAGLTDYAVLADKNYGEPGNGVSFTITENASEVQPTVTFSYVPTPAAAALSLRMNGGSPSSISVSSLTEPSAFATAVSALSGFPVQAIGGTELAVISAWANTDTLALTASGNNVTITGSVAWGNTPEAGDVLLIPVLDGGGPAEWYETTQASVLIGAGSANVGLYLVTAATSTTISATKIHDLSSETPTAPVNVSATAIGSVHDDIVVYKNVDLHGRTGTARAIVATVSGNIAGTASGNSLTLSRTIDWDVQPQVNDLILIPSTAPAAWLASNANLGWFTVTSSTASTVTMTKIDTAVAPASFASTAQAAASDLVCRRPAIDGVGKTLQLVSTSNGNNIVRSSTNGQPLPFFVTSATEQQDKIVAQKLATNTTEEITFGGVVALTVGYEGTLGTMTITNSTLTTAVTGGVGAALSINLRSYKTIGELASFINSQAGYTCTAANNLLAQAKLFPDLPTVCCLDKGTFGIGSSVAAQKPGRIKRDAYLTFVAMRDSSVLLQVGNPAAAASAGLPEAQALTFLSGGARGATSNANILAALAAAEKLTANFIVPLFSRDATDDAADLLTDASSSYTIDAVIANTKSHVLAMSQIKRSRWRQGFLSYQGTFTEDQDKAATLANASCSLSTLDVITTNSQGEIVQLQPWALAVCAAGMQAAGFYRDITGKKLNVQGVLHNDPTFDPTSDTDVETALQSGILVARAPTDGSGGFEWVSDQTTYGVDNNFVFNSIQAMYAANLVLASAKNGMQRAYKGTSLADVTAASAVGTLSSILDTMRRVKLIAPSDDTATGYKNLVVRIQGNTMICSAEIKLAVGIKFITIGFTISEVSQTASL